jgi:MFS family permease
LAWSSIYLHEYFGFRIYTPLTEEEEAHLKLAKGGKKGGSAKNLPPWLKDITSLPNLAIFMSYFCIGVALQLLRTPLIVYFIADLGATAAEVNVLFTVMAVPWCFKVIYGFLSDCLPISGLRRKPYFMTGWLVYIISNLLLMINPFPSIQVCIMLVFTQTAGYMLADVMTDALIVERSRYETQDERGTLQSKGYIIRFFGSTIAATIGAVVYNKDVWTWYLPIRLVFFINAAFPLIFLLPFVPYMLELETHCLPKNFWLQCSELFQTAQLRAVWQPMTFVYVYNALQLTNAAWMNFLVEGLHFSAWQIGVVSIAGSLMAWLGIMTYERFFFASNWRIVYFWCTTLASLIALGQLILVFGINRKWGIPDIWFSMGDDVLVEFVIAVQFLPMCIMYLGLCPPGSEGTTYAMLTTWSNLAGSLAFDISTALTVVWDVSSETIASGNYDGVWKLSLLCGLVGPMPLVLLGLIPKDKKDQRKLQKDTTRHYWAGVAFIFVMFFTLFVTFVESIYEVYFNDESSHEDGSERRRLVQQKLKRMMVGH